MRSIRVLILTGLLSAATSASAQEMYPGQGVSVNPNAAGSRVLLYPGGQYVRVLPQLAQPGAPYPGMALPPVHLHMPLPHRIARIHRAPKVATAEPDTTLTPIPDISAPPPPVETPPPTRHTRHEKKVAAAPDATPDPSAPQSSDGSASIPFSFGGSNAAPAAKASAKSAPPVSAPPAAKVAATPPPPPTRIASAEPPPAHTQAPEQPASKSTEAGFAKRGEIVFSHAATDPAPAQYDGLKLLAGDLNSALQAGATRIQLQAYGGAPGDKGSDARRLSLKRALAIRQVLIDNGVPSSKIDIRAMGGIDDKGNADRVDVLVRAS
jgi:outer membrane protein OmpA-like peptidoglycan-associated protein